MTEPTNTCKICHSETPTEGRQVCDVCMGFKRSDPSMDQITQPSIEQDKPIAKCEGVCDTCGASFEPYRLGANMVRNGICNICLMRKKYGADWVPGGKSKRPGRHREKKKAKENRNLEELKKLSQRPDFKAHEGEFTMKGIKNITIPFVLPDDEALFDRIMATAKRNRRTPEAQILFWLDSVVDV